MTRKLHFLTLCAGASGKRRQHRPLGAAILACALTLGAGPAAGAEDVLAGPVPALVEGVIDGDTLKVRAHIWLGQDVAVHVRLDGIDAPELSGGCDRERAMAERARAFLTSRLAPNGDDGPRVQLRQVRYGKYARRVVARVETAGGLDLGAALIAAGLAQAYNGGRRPAWCD